MEEIKESKFKKIYEIIIAIANIFSVTLISVLMNNDIVTVVKNVIIISILTIALVFVFNMDILKDNLLYNNKYFIKRYFISYLAFLIIAIICAYLPVEGWIFICVFITLSLFSSVNIGFVSGMTLLTVSILLSQNTGLAYLEYAIPGLIGIILFSSLDNDFNVLRPIVISISFQFLTICLGEILIANKAFSFLLFLIPFINVLISFIVLLFVLKMVSFSFIYEASDRLLDVIDLEFELLTELKNTSKEEYDSVIFTAALCSKLANSLGLSESLVKACGYYYHIGVIRGDNSWDTVYDILINHKIPDEVIELLREYLDENTPIKSKETVVLLIADTVISSIKYLFSKDKDAKIDYERLILAVFDKKITTGMISDSKISFEDINIMKKTLINEKLFYDFLR